MMTRRPLLLVKAIHFSDPVGEEDLVQNELEFLASPHSRVKESDLALGHKVGLVQQTVKRPAGSSCWSQG